MATVALSGIITPTNVVTATSTTTLTNKTIATPTITGVTTFSAGTAALPALTTSGDTNTGIFFPAADTIAFSEGGAESMRINSAGDVGVGTSSPVFGVGSGIELARSGTATYRLSSSGAGVEFRNNSGTGELEVRGAFPLVFSTNATERIRIPSDAGGITFPATQVASTNANTLDDYEEGTFSPTVIGGTSGSASYATQTGLYAKIGGWVFIQLYLSFSKNTIVGSLNIANLPFTSKSGSQLYYSTNCGYWYGLASSILTPVAFMGQNSTQFSLAKLTAASTNSGTSLTAADLNASANEFMYSLFYPVS